MSSNKPDPNNQKRAPFTATPSQSTGGSPKPGSKAKPNSKSPRSSSAASSRKSTGSNKAQTAPKDGCCRSKISSGGNRTPAPTLNINRPPVPQANPQPPAGQASDSPSKATVDHKATEESNTNKPVSKDFFYLYFEPKLENTTIDPNQLVKISSKAIMMSSMLRTMIEMRLHGNF